MTWATPEDVTSRWVGPHAPDDEPLVAQLIADAEEKIRWEYPDLPGRVVGDPPPARTPRNALPLDRVKIVVAQMVIRHLRNPEGTRQTTETEGPFSRNRTFAGDHPGELVLTDQERRMLGYLPGSPGQKAFTVPQPAPAHPAYLGGRDGW